MAMDSSKSTSQRVGRKRAVQRDRILRAAIGEFAARGYERATMQDIATTLDMTSAALYYYFKTKDDLLFAALDSVLVDLVEALVLAVEAAVSTPQTQLRALVAAHVTFELEDPTVGPLVNTHLYGPRYLVDMLSPAQQAKLKHHQRDIYNLYRSVLQQGMAQGVFSVNDLTLVIFDLLAIAQYPVVWFRPGRTLTINEVAERQAELSLRLLIEPKNGL